MSTDRDTLVQIFNIASAALNAPVATPPAVTPAPTPAPPAPGGGFGPLPPVSGPNRWLGERFSSGNVGPGWQSPTMWFEVPAGWPGTKVPYGSFLINVSFPSGAVSVYVDNVLIGPDPLYQQGSDTKVPLNPLLSPGTIHTIVVKANLTTSGSIDFNHDPR